MALAGRDGAKARELLAASQAEGGRVLAEVAASAVKRALAGGVGDSLLDRDELERLAEALAMTNATADLLARTRVRERQQKAQGGGAFGDDQPFEVFAGEPIAPLPPEQALAYFRGLVPTLGVDPERFGPLHRRQAFTLARATDDVLLQKVRQAIATALETGQGGTPDVQDILDRAGVGGGNPQYSDMVFRTNAMDAYVTGAQEELQADDMREMFPVWQYLGIRDGRQGADHEPKFDRYYPASAAFTEVRGDRPFNCRCNFSPIDKFRWEELQSQGARVEDSW